MQIQSSDNHCVTYDSTTSTVTCSGFLDLRGKQGYKNIADLFDDVVSQLADSGTVILDVKELEFLNSSGITTIGGFVIKLRNKGGIKLVIQCSEKHSWQARSMKGLQKLMPTGLDIHFE